MGVLQIKRAYVEPTNADGYRILVDRLWPRGIKKENLVLAEWCKEVAPSAELRKWFCHDIDKFSEFTVEYLAELDNSKAANELCNLVRSKLSEGNVTLLYGAKDELHNQAVVLKDWLEKHV